MAVRITITDGKCQGGFHDVGRGFLVEHTTPAGMCLGAWNAIASYVTTLLCDGDFPWEKEKGITMIHCPDPKGITLKLERVDHAPGE